MIEPHTIDEAAQRLLDAAPPASGVIVFGSNLLTPYVEAERLPCVTN